MTGLNSFQQEILTAFFELQRGFFLTGGAATPPGGVSATELQSFLESLIRRLTAMAYPD